MDLISGDPCRELAWDSSWWGIRTGEVVRSPADEGDLQLVDEWSVGKQVRLLYFLCPSSHMAVAQAAEASGFRLMDVRITLENSRTAPLPGRADHPDQVNVRVVRPDDIGTLGRMASESFRFTRFYADDALPDDRCDEMYKVWIEQDCRGGADAVLIAERQGDVAGYISCSVDRLLRRGHIGLIGVAKTARGSGIGSVLLEESLVWFEGEGAVSVSVVTQGRNTSALRLYERHGFVHSDTSLWFHKWYPAGADA